MQNMAEAGQLHKSALILLFAAAKKGRKRRSSLWRRPLRLSSSAMSYGVSGPRVVNKRKQSRVRGILGLSQRLRPEAAGPMTSSAKSGNGLRARRRFLRFARLRHVARRNDVLNRNRAVPGWLFQRLRCCSPAPTGKRWQSAPKHAVIRSGGLARSQRQSVALRRKSKRVRVGPRPPTRRRSRGLPAN